MSASEDDVRLSLYVERTCSRNLGPRSGSLCRTNSDRLSSARSSLVAMSRAETSRDL